MSRRPTLRHMRGVSLVTAIFLLVVLSGLAVAIVTLSTSAQNSSTLDVQGTRAYLAARAGAEWGVFQVTRVKGACTAAPSAASTFAMPADGGLARMTVTVVCKRTVDSATQLARYTLRSTACNYPDNDGCPNRETNSIDYVQRVVHIEFSASAETP